MKTKIQYILGIFILSIFTVQLNAGVPSGKSAIAEVKLQSSVTDTVKVWGNCDMCKKTIETSAKKVTGVQNATWNKETKMLAVTYSGISKKAEVEKAVAGSGYDTQDMKATDEAYNKLPSCCKYTRK